MESKLTIHGLGHKKAPTVGYAIRVFIFVDRHIVDLTFLKTRGPDVIDKRNRVVLLTASTAEMGGVETLRGVSWIEDLPLES